ncbi:MAG: response regulator transcription factor [Clostridia bacterium]|nr:response regulator transcription factor [Clostridia bacterium]
MAGEKILVVDDEKLIVKGIKFGLDQDGYEVDSAFDGDEAYEKASSNNFDLIVLDVMLPKKDGLEVCQMLRADGNRTPIIMLTAKGEDMDKIMGLEYGADDYMTKPFNILELKARIKAILRRASGEGAVKDSSLDTIINVKGLEMNLEARSVVIDGKEINLTAKEFDILHLLITNPNKVYSRDVLLNKIWGYEYPGDERTVDVHMRRLREKIEEDASNPKYLYTK